jgi:hypothetical protein
MVALPLTPWRRHAVESPFSACLPHGTFERRVSTPHFQPFGPSVELFRLLCPLLTSPPRSRALRPAQSGSPNTSEISRGKTDRLRRTPAGFTTPILDGRGLRDICSLVRLGRPRIRFLSIGPRLCSTLPSDPTSRKRLAARSRLARTISASADHFASAHIFASRGSNNWQIRRIATMRI